MGKHLFTYTDPVPTAHLDKICAVLQRGGTIAYPTDVNWALGCDATSIKAVTRLRQIKQVHPRAHPFSLICTDMSMVARVANVDNRAFKIMRKLLPGPYTLILKSNRTLSKQIKDRRLNVGVRVPHCELLQVLTASFGKPLATTTTHSDGSEEFRFGYEVQEKYGHTLDLLIDLGTEITPLQTTIIDFSTDIPVVIRRGAGAVDDLL